MKRTEQVNFYDVGNGFFVMEKPMKNEPEYNEYWLGHEEYGIMELMYGEKKTFFGRITNRAQFPEIDAYIDDYIREYIGED